MSDADPMADLKMRLARLWASLPLEECKSCDCLQGFLAQLQIDLGDTGLEVARPFMVPRQEMHGCLGCDPCPPGEAFSAYLRTPKAVRPGDCCTEDSERTPSST
jgi:hypothetical protein